MGRLANVIRPSVFANPCFLKLGSYSPTETGKIGALSSLTIKFQSDGPQVLEKDIPEI